MSCGQDTFDVRYPLTAALQQTSPEVRLGPRPCEKALTLDHDRTSYSPKAAFGAHTQADSSLRPNPENVILVALRLFAFSHSLGQERTLRGKIERAGGKGLDTRPAKNLFMTKARSGIAHVSVA